MRPNGTSAGSAALLLAALLLSLLGVSPAARAEACPNEAIREAQHSTFLPDCRAYEMVSPPLKNGGGVSQDSGRTPARADGNAVGFDSTTAFGDAVGAQIATEYLAERVGAGVGPYGTGWVVHALTPPQEALTFQQAGVGVEESRYEGDYQAAFEQGVFNAVSPLTDEPDVAAVSNLYLRTDLLSAGLGSYQLVTACPRCRARDETEGPGKGALPPPTATDSIEEGRELEPIVAGVDYDRALVLFESGERLTVDTAGSKVRRLYESEQGTVRLAARIPSGAAVECDDATPTPCVPAAGSSYAGAFPFPQQDKRGFRQERPNVLSDGSDGHTRVFFTYEGRLYLREDGHRTVQLDASERAVADTFAPARFVDASADGERAFFTTAQALTDGATTSTPGGFENLYMYDATKSGSDPHNLTLLAANVRSEDLGSSVVGVSHDGTDVYYAAEGQLRLWRGGITSSVFSIEKPPEVKKRKEGDFINFNGVTGGFQHRYFSRVTPDGSHLLFAAEPPGEGLNLFLYDATRSTPSEPDVVCVSCPGPGVTQMSGPSLRTIGGNGVSSTSQHLSHALADDGRYVFFNTADPLVPEDHNRTEDAYEFDTVTGELHLLSSGAEAEGAASFLDASADGSNVFIATAQPLVGWDRDEAFDLYDVRVDGGFPEPAAASCGSSDQCAGGPVGVPSAVSAGSGAGGPGNPPVQPAGNRPGTAPKCSHGEHVARVKGRLECVRPRCAHRERLVRVKGRWQCVKVTAHRPAKRMGRR